MEKIKERNTEVIDKEMEQYNAFMERVENGELAMTKDEFEKANKEWRKIMTGNDKREDIFFDYNRILGDLDALNDIVKELKHMMYKNGVEAIEPFYSYFDNLVQMQSDVRLWSRLGERANISLLKKLHKDLEKSEFWNEPLNEEKVEKGLLPMMIYIIDEHIDLACRLDLIDDYWLKSPDKNKQKLFKNELKEGITSC